MIDGVTILATETVMTSCLAMNVILSIIIGLIVLGFVLFLSGMIADCIGIGITGGIMMICAFLSLLIGIPIDCATQIPDYTKYEVIIDDSVSMNEFTEKYEVLEQRGQIYVIKEIEE